MVFTLSLVAVLKLAAVRDGEEQCFCTAGAVRTVFWQYALGSCILLLVTGINGELLAGARLFVFEPIVFFKILAYSLPLYLGIQLLLQITNEFGATMTTAVTATRKVLTFVMSYLLLPRKSKPLSMLHIVGVGISFASTFLIQSSATPARGGPHKIHDHMHSAASSHVTMYRSKKNSACGKGRGFCVRFCFSFILLV